MARLRLDLRFRIFHLMFAVFVTAILLPLFVRRYQYDRVGHSYAEMAKRSGTMPQAVRSFRESAAAMRGEAVRYDWLIATLVIGPALVWFLRSSGIIHRARLRALARQYAPPPSPERYRPPDHSELLASRSFHRTGDPRSILRERP